MNDAALKTTTDAEVMTVDASAQQEPLKFPEDAPIVDLQQERKVYSDLSQHSEPVPKASYAWKIFSVTEEPVEGESELTKTYREIIVKVQSPSTWILGKVYLAENLNHWNLSTLFNSEHWGTDYTGLYVERVDIDGVQMLELVLEIAFNLPSPKDDVTPVQYLLLNGITALKPYLYRYDLALAAVDPTTELVDHPCEPTYLILMHRDLKARTYRNRFESVDQGESYVGVVAALNHVPTVMTDSVEKLLASTAPGNLLERIEQGLYGELEQPTKGSEESRYERQIKIDPENIAVQILEVWLDKDYGKNNPEVMNPNMAAIMGRIKPAGPRAETARRILSGQQPGRMVYRALTEHSPGGCFDFKHIVTFDITAYY